jgi:Cft2 family RNA processing exonuclease
VSRRVYPGASAEISFRAMRRDKPGGSLSFPKYAPTLKTETFFHWEDGLKLTESGLAIDFRRRQSRAFISHAHSDHIGRHEYALCTPETAALYQLRLGKRATLHLPYRQPLQWSGLRLTTYPAGHCLGSAMLLAEDGEQSLLYTGDFKLGESATSERAELPHAEILVIESTYGTPSYRLPPREETIEKFIALVRKSIENESTPVILTYALGKSQEVTKILTSAGIGVVQHRKVFDVSEVYEQCGMPLGGFKLFEGHVEPGKVLIVPPNMGHFDRIGRQTRFAVTGWAVDSSAKYRFHVDHAIPLSDHADFDELLEAVRIVNPRVVYCTHGPESFVDRVRDIGFDAHPLGRPSQGRLF